MNEEQNYRVFVYWANGFKYKFRADESLPDFILSNHGEAGRFAPSCLYSKWQ